MLPGFSRQNAPDAMLANTIAFAKFGLGKLGSSNFFDICFGGPGLSGITTSLRGAIKEVVTAL